MSAAQNTPGPWMVEPIDGGLTYQVTTSEETGFKVICETGWGDDVDAANARLIAAAPDLLKALGVIIRHVNAIEMAAVLAAHYPAGFANMQDAVTAALSALAKARGDA